MNRLFLDSETAPRWATFDQVPEAWQEQWMRTAKKYLKAGEEMTPERAAGLWGEKAGLHAEYSKVVCISVAALIPASKKLKLKSFYGEDEKAILTQLATVLTGHYNDLNRAQLVAHNLKGFDVPFIVRRMMLHGIELPKALDVQHLKPWETAHLYCTMEAWRVLDKAYTSLALMCLLYDVPSPKDGMTGADVSAAYYDGHHEAIANYCEKDVWALAQLFYKMNGLPVPVLINPPL